MVPQNSIVIKQRIAARGTKDSDDGAWTVARGIGRMLKNKYQAKNVLVFGSLAKKYWTRNSDIDIAVRGVPAALFFRAFLDAETFAGSQTIDLVDLDDLPLESSREIEIEGVPV
jgi:predicted nucleotidyltransferase